MNLTSYLKANLRVLLVGPPGCAKTARIAAAAAAADYRLHVFRASLSERVDVGGALIPDVEAGITRALPLEALHRLRNTKENTILFLDDLGQAPMDVQAALMKLFDPGELPENVLIWGATNRPGDRAGVSGLCEPLRSRFHLAFEIPTPGASPKTDGGALLGTWEEEVQGWGDWAMDAGADPAIVAWHSATNGRTLYAWTPSANPAVRMPDFRAWETVIHLRRHSITDLATTAAAIGIPAAAEFTAFERLAAELATPDQIFLDPNGAPVPSDPSALYLIAANLAATTTLPTVEAASTYADRMPKIYAAFFFRTVYRRLGARLSGHRSWQKWFLANRTLFEGL